MKDPGVIAVRPFLLEEDLERAADFGARAREEDAAVEPFAQRLGIIAEGPRALLDLWRVAEGEDGLLHGIAFAALREARKRKAAPVGPALAGTPVAEETAPLDDAHVSVEIYGAVAKSLRRQGLGRELFAPVLEWASGEPDATLRARIREGPAGEGFLKASGFALASAQLSLSYSGAPPPRRDVPGVVVKPLDRRDARGLAAFRRLSNEAWSDAFETRADELEQLIGDLGRLILLGELQGEICGYLSGVYLGQTLALEEVAVMPAARRFGVGRALVVEALARSTGGALLTVSEKNTGARALYKSLGFRQQSRRQVWEKKP